MDSGKSTSLSHPSSLSAYELLRSDFAFLLVSGHIGVVDDFCRLVDAEDEHIASVRKHVLNVRYADEPVDGPDN